MGIIDAKTKAETLRAFDEIAPLIRGMKEIDPGFYNDMRVKMFSLFDVGMHFITTGRSNGKTNYFSQLYKTVAEDKPIIFYIHKVIFNAPATIVYWTDGTKTVVKCQPGDVYSEELGLAMAISKKYLGNKGNFNDEFKKWLPEKTEATDIHNVSISEKKARLDRYCEFNICPRCELNESGCPGAESDRGFYDLSDAEICRLYDKVFRQKN